MRPNVAMTAALLGALALATIPGCAAEQEEAGSSEDAITKPDLKARFADVRKIDTGDLSRIAMKLGTDGLNGALKLKSDYASLGIHVDNAEVFGATAEQNSVLPSDVQVKSLDAIHNGLAADLGEKELPTELTRLRLAHVQNSEDKYFIETGFGVSAGVNLNLSHITGGFGDNNISLRLGFKAGGDLSTRVVVAAPESKILDLLSASGEAIMQMRSFVIPEKAEDMLKMKPGEMFGLRGTGTYGANFGVGVPILVANAGPFAYTVAVSGALSHTVTGLMDVQVARLDGDQVAVDVGISDGKIDQASIGVFGGWGVNNSCDDGTYCLDSGVGKIVRSGLLKALTGFMASSVSVRGAIQKNRLELARMRFHLNQPETAQALEQALHGDLRYAQALYARNMDQADPPVMFDLDMLRASTTTTRAFGADVFGISVYHRIAVEKTGSFAIQTPDGVQSVLWNSFQKKGGWFQMEHGDQLTAVSTAGVNAADPDKTINRANFLVQTVVGDKAMDDDVILDSADQLIAATAGADSLATLDAYGTPMQQAVGRECPVTHSQPPGGKGAQALADRELWDESCNVALIQDETRQVVDSPEGKLSLVEARTRGVAAFLATPGVTRLPDSYRDLMSKAAGLRLTLQMVKIHALTSNNGPGVSFALNYRLDNTALDMLAKADPNAYGKAVEQYLMLVAGARAGIQGTDPIKDNDAHKAGQAMLKEMQKFQANYRNIGENESQDLPRLLADKPWVRLPIGIRFDVSDVREGVNSAERMKKYAADVDRIRVESISHQRAMLAKILFDALVSAADDNIGFSNSKQRLFAEQAAAYPIISMIPAENMEVGMDLSATVESSFWYKRERFIQAGFQAISATARGSEVENITAHLFDINKMMQ